MWLSGLGVAKDGLELWRGRGDRGQVVRDCPERGREPRSSDLGVTVSGLGPGRESFGTEVKRFGSGCEVREDRGWLN